MEVTQFIGIRSVVDFLRIKQLLHSACHIRHIGHEEIALLIG